jgi:hypothetical protein
MKRMPSGLVFARCVAWAALLVLGAHAQAQTDALPYHLNVGGLDSTFGRGDLGAAALTSRLVAQTSGAPATAGATAAEPDGPEESASALNRKLTNPVSSLWSITNQFNKFKLENGHWNNNWNFQPVLPVSLTRDVNLITRPVMPFYNIVPHETASGQFERTAGLGDLILLERSLGSIKSIYVTGCPTRAGAGAGWTVIGRGRDRAWSPSRKMVARCDHFSRHGY